MIQIHKTCKMQPTLDSDQGMEIPAITLKLARLTPVGLHDE